MGLSSFGSMPVETVAEVNPKLFFQTYWSGTRDQITQRTERARQAGAKALIVTLDWSFSNGRDWGSPTIPEKIDLRTLLRLAPEGIGKPGYVRDWLRHGGLPDLTVPNMAAPGEQAPTFFGVYGEWMRTPRPAGTTSRGCASSGVARSWSRASCGPTTPAAPSTSGPPRSRYPTTAATTWTAPPPPSGPCPASPTPWAGRSRCCSTAGSRAAVTWSRPWRSAPERS